MEFVVPRGGSNICHIDVTPTEPIDGAAQPWAMVESIGKQNVDTLDTLFSSDSTPEERQSEHMIFVFNISQSVQTDGVSWRFFESGMMYCEDEGDYLGNLSSSLSNDGKTLTIQVKCLAKVDESFNFTFMAIRRETSSGECRILASADPRGGLKRP